jgi:AraC-like DNA-binding protein
MAAAANREVENRSYWRSSEIPGFEFLEATASTGPWQIYNVRYAISIPETWAAPVNHDGRNVDLGPGHAFLVRPGEIHSSPGASRPGTLRALVIADEALEQYAGDYLARPTDLDWKAGTLRCSQELSDAYRRVFSAFRSAPTAMQVQSTMVDLFAIMLREVVACPPSLEKATDCSRQAARMRELMHHGHEGLTMGLDDLAKAVGLTRFQALRAFKRRYGIPPHAYQLTVRTGLAVPLLLRGESVTHVAHELGFTDQSHFTRHFKRIWRITPGNYARGADLVPFAQRRACTSQSDGVTYSA